jgi:putative DNA primase/helicase
MTETLQSLYALFGNAVFLPLKFGTKKLQLPRWGNITFADSQSSDYQNKLRARLAAGGNIACRCGPPSDNLISIDIDDDARLSDFLGLNSWSSNTLITKGKKGANVWFRSASANYPNGQAYYRLLTNSGQAYGEFRCGGAGGAYTVIFGRHPDAIDYQILQRKPASVLDVSQINWPSDVILPWLSQSAGPTTGPPPTNAFPLANERPCYCLYESLVSVNGKPYAAGVYYHGVERDRKGKMLATYDDWIGAQLKVAAQTANREDGEHGLLLEYQSKTGQDKKWAMPCALLAGREPTEILSRLYSDGYKINYPHRKKICEYISTAEPLDFLRCATTTGWHSEERFVLPDEVIGKGGIWFQSNARLAAYAKAGDLKSWQDSLGLWARYNPYLMFALSFSLCGPLLKRLGFSGAGVHFHGDTSIGKTTVLEAGASVWGSPERYKRAWRATANGLEGVCAQHTDTLLVLDEISEIDGHDLEQVAYFLVNGQGKTRADRNGEPRPAMSWRVPLLSSGEQSIRVRLSEAGLTIKEGQRLRILDIPVSAQYGLFDDLHNLSDGAQFSKAIRQKANEHYGHAGPEFVRLIVGKDASELVRLHGDYLADYTIANSQEGRAAGVFALAALAGELATMADLAPWDQTEARDAALALYEKWKQARETSVFGSEHSEILRRIADFIDRHSESRFSNITPVPNLSPSGHVIEPPIIRDRAGWWDDASSKRFYLFTSGGLREATKGFDFNRALAALDAAGAFAKTGSSQIAVTTRIPDGRTPRLYWIDPAKLSS